MSRRSIDRPVRGRGRRITAGCHRALPLAAALALCCPECAAAANVSSAFASSAESVQAPPKDVLVTPPRGEADLESARIIARMVYELGGNDAWSVTRYLTWRSFTGRRYLWDRHGERVRVEFLWGKPAAEHVIVLDLAAGTGRAWREEEEIVDAAQRSEVLKEARTWFAEESFQLAMPYRLRELGVRVRSFGIAQMTDGRPADILEVTFPGVASDSSAGASGDEGDVLFPLPTGKYWIYVDRDSGIVGQWDMFKTPDATQPAQTFPWRGWKKFGEITLSEDRGERRLSDIEVLEDVIDGIFDAPFSAASFGIPEAGD